MVALSSYRRHWFRSVGLALIWLEAVCAWTLTAAEVPGNSGTNTLTAEDIYRLGMPTHARALSIGREVLLDISVSIAGSGGTLGEIPVPDGLRWNPSSGLIHAHLFNLSGPLRDCTNGSRLRIRGMIVDEGYGAYMIYVRGTPERLPPLTVSDIAASLKNCLMPHWSLTVSNQTIRIINKEDAQFVRAWLPGETEGHHAQRPESFREKYAFTLTFVPRLTDAEFEKLRAERQAFERNLEAGGENAVSAREKALAKYPLPRFYTPHHSIYLHLPHTEGYGLVPPGVDSQAVHDLFALKFHPYPPEP